ncbi:hypothetical protein [Arthrobacter sp. ISL-85]|uniref:hypothetical protein n=1 Tax=Arthrobacter sp. ISL-85 TaxID=2819115 RepID=UPI00203540A3|nr:hypothetical protein [Arthrobacter sp. ISL-85]
MIADPQTIDLPTVAAGAHPLSYHNWVHLNPGDRIIVNRSGFAPEQGTVDDISADASYFWVWIDGQSRILIFHGDGSVINRLDSRPSRDITSGVGGQAGCPRRSAA